MKFLFIAFIFPFTMALGKSESIILVNYTGSDTQKNCNIVAHYGDFITFKRASYNGKEYLRQDIVESPKTNCFSPVTNNTVYINYILTNYSSGFSYSDELQNVRDSAMLQKQFIDSLQKDTLFNRVMTELASKTFNQTAPKDTFTMNKMLDVAVKFFSVMGIDKNGRYKVQVCAGMNDIKKTEQIKRPLLEAFCFSAIFKNMTTEKHSIMDRLVKSAQDLYKVNLGNDQNERLLRAQGALYFMMRNEKDLKKLLKHEYKVNKKNLPFVLKD